MSGKGSKPRPLSVEPEEYSQRWNAIFGKKDKQKASDYQDVLSTEDCVLEALDKVQKQDK